ncbi:glycoside hydrolase family 16 protein [Klebsiella aerogenes]
MSTPILPFLPDNADWIYQPDLSDEFNGPDLDPRWCPYYQASWGDLDASRARYRFITESDGTVSLELYVDNAGQGYWQPWRASNNTYKVAGITGGTRDYMNMWPSGGFPITNHMPYYDAFATRYGYFEIRTRFLSGSGLAPAFWFLGMQDAAYTENMEVDSPEVFTLENVVKFNLLPRQGEASQSLVTAYGEGATLPDLDDGYHIYGLEWDPEYLKLYIDGQLVSTIETEIDYRMFPLISLNHHETNNAEVGNIYDNDPPLPNDETFTIDYYRVFKKADTPADPWPNYQNPLLPGYNIAERAFINIYGYDGDESTSREGKLNDSDHFSVAATYPKGSGTEEENERWYNDQFRYIYIEWHQPVDFDTLVLYATQAQSTAPQNIRIEVSADGYGDWTIVKPDFDLDWQTDDPGIAEGLKITLDTPLQQNQHARIVINTAPESYALSEIEIGTQINATTRFK